jgi:hypothetical protein
MKGEQSAKCGNPANIKQSIILELNCPGARLFRKGHGGSFRINKNNRLLSLSAYLFPGLSGSHRTIDSFGLPPSSLQKR